MARGKAALERVTARRYWREADARVVVEAWRRSGLPLAVFAGREGVHPKRLARWSGRLRATDPEPEVAFHPVRLVDAGGGAVRGEERIEVVLRDGTRVRVPRVFAAEDLRRVVEVLEGRGSC